MNRAFIDTDVMIDLVTDREPFSTHAAVLFTLIEHRRVTAYTSTIALLNLFYVVRRLLDASTARTKVTELRALVEVLAVDASMFDRALVSPQADLEDSVQLECALSNEIEFVITRNTKDFRKRRVTAVTPQDYLLLIAAAE